MAKKRDPKVVTRVWAVPKTMAVLVGYLEYAPGRGVNRGDVMHISVYCPFCKCEHNHGWGFDGVYKRVDHAEHRGAHCHTQESPLKEPGYYIALDPTKKADHVRVFAAVAAMVKLRGK